MSNKKPRSEAQKEVLEKACFKKGNPGGPGRTAGKPLLRTVLRKALEKEIDVNDPKTQEKMRINPTEAIAIKLVEKAMDGNLRAIEMVFDRIDGKVADMLHLGGIEDSPIEVVANVKYNLDELSVEELKNIKALMGKIQPKDIKVE